jgi:AcrR family transcriptional regulator
MTIEREASEKHERILEGAMQEFLQRGYAGTSMDRVASTAGVSKATIYSHFGDKERLFKELVQHFAQRKLGSIQRQQPLTGEPEEVLREFAQMLINETGSDPDHLALVRLMIGESSRFPQLAQTFLRHFLKPGLEVICEYLEDQTQLQIEDPEATARVFVGALIHYVMVEKIIEGGEVVPMGSDRMIEAAIALLLSSTATASPTLRSPH